MSASGTKRTSMPKMSMSASGDKRTSPIRNDLRPSRHLRQLSTTESQNLRNSVGGRGFLGQAKRSTHLSADDYAIKTNCCEKWQRRGSIRFWPVDASEWSGAIAKVVSPGYVAWSKWTII